MLIGKKIGKAAAVVAIALSLAFAPGLFSAPKQVQAATSISQLQNKLETLKKQQAEAAAKLKTLKADKTQKVAYKNALDAQMNNVQGQIDNYNTQISTLNANIKTKSAEITAKQATIDQNFEKLRERVHALYLMGEASNLEIILNAKDIVDFADKTEMLRAITKHDSQLIDTLKADLKSIQAQKAEIESNRTQVAAAKTQLETKRSELDDLVKEAQTVVDEINKDVNTASVESAKLAAEREKTDAAIDQWYKDYYAKQGSGTSGSGGYISKGNFMWPLPGYSATSNITSVFGKRWGRLHKGVDISGSGVYGKPIVAADSGRVIQVTSGWGGGYGNSVCIDHGGSYSTRYAHCSSVIVREGQQVTKGQVIGYVGNTGDSYGAHLHFEIRVNGVPQNPLNWFSR